LSFKDSNNTRLDIQGQEEEGAVYPRTGRKNTDHSGTRRTRDWPFKGSKEKRLPIRTGCKRDSYSKTGRKINCNFKDRNKKIVVRKRTKKRLIIQEISLQEADI
jgi:hypothetical protein